MDFFKKKKVMTTLALILVFSLVVPVVSGMFTITAHAVDIEIYRNGFEENSDGWKYFYNGKVSRTTEASASGSYSLKMTNRNLPWHSPGINIYSLIKANGAGKYTVSMNDIGGNV